MPSLEKVIKFATNSEFRWAKARAYAWPLVRFLYPNIECIGISDRDRTTLLFSDDRFITMEFIKFGTNNSAQMALVLTLLKERGSDLSGCFFEIGANVGSESIDALVSGPFSRAILVEPEPRNAALLRSNLALNGVTHRAHVFEVGASNSPGTATLTLSGNNRGDHRISSIAGEKMAIIAIKTADQILVEAGVAAKDVSLVWIDTQGYDGYVLAGAQSLAAEKVPFVMEFTPDTMREVGCFDLCINTIKQRFDGFYDLTENQPIYRQSRDIDRVSERLSGTGAYADLMLIP